MDQNINAFENRIKLVELSVAVTNSAIVNTSMDVNDVAPFLTKVYDTIADIVDGASDRIETYEEEPIIKLVPKVSIRSSVKPDHITCLEDGHQVTLLKPYLKTNYNMTPEEYRERWGLASDYPMVAPNYSARRSELAKLGGLGTKGRGGRPIPLARQKLKMH